MNTAVILVSYQALPEQAANARRELQVLIATVQATEPECRGIDLLEDAADPTRFMLVERWTSPEAFFGPHMQQPHLLAFIERAGTFLAKPPDIAHWRQVAHC